MSENKRSHKRKPVDAKALAKKLIEKQLMMFEKEARDNTAFKLAPSEMSWLLDVFKTMAEQEDSTIKNPYADADEEDLEDIVRHGKA